MSNPLLYFLRYALYFNLYNRIFFSTTYTLLPTCPSGIKSYPVKNVGSRNAWAWSTGEHWRWPGEHWEWSWECQKRPTGEHWRRSAGRHWRWSSGGYWRWSSGRRWKWSFGRCWKWSTEEEASGVLFHISPHFPSHPLDIYDSCLQWCSL